MRTPPPSPVVGQRIQIRDIRSGWAPAEVVRVGRVYFYARQHGHGQTTEHSFNLSDWRSSTYVRSANGARAATDEMLAEEAEFAAACRSLDAIGIRLEHAPAALNTTEAINAIVDAAERFL